MVQIFDCCLESGSEPQCQIADLNDHAALLLKGYGLLPTDQQRSLRHQLVEKFAPVTQVTGLDAQLNALTPDLALAVWAELEPASGLTHLLIHEATSPSATLKALERLIQIVAQLRAPDGCPWDRAQTPESLTPYVIEEAYETVAAIRSREVSKIADELGDLLLQVVLQSQIFMERGAFDLGTVAQGIGDKLVRRHPHVFGSDQGADLEGEALHRRWEEIKQAETPDQSLGDKLLHYAESLPPLMAAMKISKRVARAGFEWPQIEGVWAKLVEEEQELKEILDTPLEECSEQEIQEIQRKRAAELGDLLFTWVNLGRWYDLDASAALQEMNRRFAHRIQAMEQLVEAGDLSGHPLEELENLWQQAKQQFPY